MKVKLKTEEQLIEEFNFKKRDYDMGLETFHDNKKWVITPLQLKFLGKVVKVELIEGLPQYTHIHEIDGLVLGLHELWFEPYKFIYKEEFEI